ncbi:MAG: hypothetical protein H5T80_12080 [Dietzia sp.]|nr:hypothetical protein [Dietzia sp.]
MPPTVPPDITGPQVDAISGGWVLTFTTAVPDQTAEGPYELRVLLKRGGIARADRLTVTLGDLPLPPRPPKTLFTATTARIPAAATRRVRGERTIGIGFRSAGTATVTLVAPSGETTTLTRQIGTP